MGFFKKTNMTVLILGIIIMTGNLFASDPEYFTRPLQNQGDVEGPRDSTFRWGLDYANVTVYRFDFADRMFNISESDIQKEHSRVVNFYSEASDGLFDLSFDIHPEVIKLDRTFEDYNEHEDGFHFWTDDFEGALLDLGVDPDDPGKGELIIVAGPKFKFSSAGSYPLMKIYDRDYEYDAIRHELGHGLGLRHAQGLEAGNNIVGVEDRDAEHHNYGNVYDVMGEGDYDEHFNLVYKNYFDWFRPGEIKQVVTSGIYRIYTHDQPTRSGETIGLTLKSDHGRYTYWLEFRTNGPEVSKNGIQVNLEGYMDNTPDKEWYRDDYGAPISYLLDMTPNSLENDTWHANDFKDAELLVGMTFEEPDGAFTITPLEVSSNVENEQAWIDVEITLKNSVTVRYPSKSTVSFSINGDVPGRTFNLTGQKIKARSNNPYPLAVMK